MQVNGFGNLENKSLELDDNINILYGKNETKRRICIESSRKNDPIFGKQRAHRPGDRGA